MTDYNPVEVAGNGQCSAGLTSPNMEGSDCKPWWNVSGPYAATFGSFGPKHIFEVVVNDRIVAWTATAGFFCFTVADRNNLIAHDQVDCVECGNGPEYINTQTPIVLDMLGNGYDLTGFDAGVRFDLNADGIREPLSWTSHASDDSWLALDRNGNGVVDSGRELFGDITPQPTSQNPNGFLALAVFDLAREGGNNDGRIDARDAVFGRLLVWNDANHDGISQIAELRKLAVSSVTGIALHYEETRRRDRWGNWFRYRARVDHRQGGAASRWAYDVYLLTAPAT